MVENTFRSFRNSRDSVARADVDPTAQSAASDPLAELARLIGASEPRGATLRNLAAAPSFDDAAPSGGLDWASEDGYAEQDQQVNSYPQARSPEPQSSYPAARGYAQQDRPFAGQAQAAAVPLASHAAPLAYPGDDAHDAVDYAIENDPRYRGDYDDAGRTGTAVAAFAPASPDDRYLPEAQDGAGNQGYADYAGDPMDGRRRNRKVVLASVLGLVVLGSVAAYAYQASFKGSSLLSLPPIIKASDGPNKIVPAVQPGGSNQANAGKGATSEKLVSREEQPVDLPPGGQSGPRVVSTIPVLPSPGTGPSAGPQTASAGPPGSLGIAPMSAASPPPVLAAPVQTVAPAAQLPASPEPHKIHTVIIRSGGNDGATAPAARSGAQRPASRQAQIQPPPSGPNAPLALVPQADVPQPAPVRTRVATARSSAPMGIEPAASAPAPAGGGYAVQVTSQRTEAEAQTAFRSLRAKYPKELGSRAPFIRRADLGSKGTYYRAMVGPFASMEEAAGVCSGLKAEGGNCIVQRN